MASADATLARFLIADGSSTTSKEDVTAAYAKAFRPQATYRERGSVVEHLEDLSELVPSRETAEILDDIRATLLRTSG